MEPPGISRSQDKALPGKSLTLLRRVWEDPATCAMAIAPPGGVS